MKAYTFNQYKVTIEKGEYPNGRLALLLVEANTGEELYFCTVNIPEVYLLPDEIIIKNWAENDGMLDFLVQNGIISKSKRSFPVGAGFVNAIIVDLLICPFD